MLCNVRIARIETHCMTHQWNGLLRTPHKHQCRSEVEVGARVVPIECDCCLIGFDSLCGPMPAEHPEHKVRSGSVRLEIERSPQ
jgi:hypothetical protein